MAGRLWVDVEDLFLYAHSFPRPTGIQRVAFEIARALWLEAGAGGKVGFLRHDTARNGFREVPWSDVAAMFARLAETEPPLHTSLAHDSAAGGGAQQSSPAFAPSAARRMLRRMVHRLPPACRVLAIDAMVAQEQALRSWAALFRALGRALVGAGRGSDPSGAARQGGSCAQPGAGDTVLSLGGAWSHPDYPGMIRRLQRRHQVRFVMLLHDIIPLRRPEWCDPGLADRFRRFIEGMLPLCDRVLAVSHASAADVTAYAREQGIVLAHPVQPIPLGTGFGTSHTVLAPRSTRLPPAGSYALMVGTLEARKNHILLFRVWRQLLGERPNAAVPTLVFAGRIGWLVGDLLQQIANTRQLDGKLILVENPSDSEVAALYQGCRFTLFPSAYEGWGLPVTESLAFGKACLTADRTSLPEAGGGLARHFDPDNLADACDAVRRVISDPIGLAQWEAEIRQRFRPIAWSASAQAVLAALDQPVAG